MGDTNGAKGGLVAAGDTLFCLEVYIADMQAMLFTGNTRPTMILSLLDFEPIVFELPPPLALLIRPTSRADHQQIDSNSSNGHSTEEKRHRANGPPTTDHEEGCPTSFHFGRGKSCSFKAEPASVCQTLCTADSLSLVVASRLSRNQAVLHGSCAINLSSFGPDIRLSRARPNAVSCWGYSTNRVKAKDTRGRVVATVDLSVSLACLGTVAELLQTPNPQSLAIAATGGGTICSTCIQGEPADPGFAEGTGHTHSDNNSSSTAKRDTGNAHDLDQAAARVAVVPQAERRRNDLMGDDLRDQRGGHIVGEVATAGDCDGGCSTDGVGIRGEVSAKTLGSSAGNNTKPAPMFRLESEHNIAGASESSGNETWVCEFDPRDGVLKEVTTLITAAASTASTDASATSAAVASRSPPPNDTPAIFADCRPPGGNQSILGINNITAVAPGATTDAPPGAAGTLNLVANSLGATSRTGGEVDASHSEATINTTGTTSGALVGEAPPAASSGGVEDRTTLSKDKQSQSQDDKTLHVCNGTPLKATLTVAAVAGAVAVAVPTLVTSGEGHAGVRGGSEERSRSSAEGVQEMPANAQMMVIGRGEQLISSHLTALEASDEKPTTMEGKVIRVKNDTGVRDANPAKRVFPGNNILITAWRPASMSREGQPGGISYDGRDTVDVVTSSAESHHIPIENIDSPSYTTTRRTEGGLEKHGGSRATPQTAPSSGKGNSIKVIIDRKTRTNQRSKASTSATPVCRKKLTPRPQAMHARTSSVSVARRNRLPLRRTAGTSIIKVSLKEGGKHVVGQGTKHNTRAVDGINRAIPTRRPWGAGPGARATCWSSNSPVAHTRPGGVSPGRKGQPKGMLTKAGNKSSVGSRGRESRSPSNRSSPPPLSSIPSMSLPGSVAIQHFLPTWTSLVAEAVWLRGSTQGGRGGDDDANSAEISGGGGKHASDTINTHGVSVSPRAAAGLFYDLGSEVRHDKQRKQCQLSETRGAASTDKAGVVVMSSCTVADRRVNRQGADGRDLTPQRADPLAVPALDPAVERLLMDWLRSRLDRASRTRKSTGNQNDREHTRTATTEEQISPWISQQQSKQQQVRVAPTEDETSAYYLRDSPDSAGDDVTRKSASARGSNFNDTEELFRRVFEEALATGLVREETTARQGNPCGRDSSRSHYYVDNLEDNKPNAQEGESWTDVVRRVPSMLDDNPHIGATKDQLLDSATPHQHHPVEHMTRGEQQDKARVTITTTITTDHDVGSESQRGRRNCASSDSLRPPAICVDVGVARQPPPFHPRSPARRVLPPPPETRTSTITTKTKLSPSTPLSRSPPGIRSREEEHPGGGLRPPSPMNRHRHHHQVPTQSQQAVVTTDDVGFPQPESPRCRRAMGIPSSPRAVRWLGSNKKMISHDDTDGGTTTNATAVDTVRTAAVVAMNDVGDRGKRCGGGGGDGSAGGVKQTVGEAAVVAEITVPSGVAVVEEAGAVDVENNVGCILMASQGDDSDARGFCARARSAVKGVKQHREDEDDRVTMVAVEEYESDFEAEEE